MSLCSDDFFLSASLSGHEKDVRAVCFLKPDTVVTASRDCTVQAWNRSSNDPTSYSAVMLAQAPYSFNSLAYLPPSNTRPNFPCGLVLAGSQGHTIEVRRPEADMSTDRVALLTGHLSNVSTIDVSPSGDFIVSGDWDGRVKLWNTDTWEAGLELIGPNSEDKQRAIWAVLAYSNTVVVTGSADHIIRGYVLQGTRDANSALRAEIVIRTPDVVRALSRVHKHPTGAKIASAGNDCHIRLWKFNGDEVGVLHGHESFIYALDSLPSGELISSSEDRTVRVWKDTSCIQTITHPALSIWSVSVCQQTGDFVTGASDNVARIFTRSSDRIALPSVLETFHDSVQRSVIPQQQVGDVNPNTLPGPEFIETNVGTKDGQTIMVNSGNSNISVYQWSIGQNQWLLVGTVVDSLAAEREPGIASNIAVDSVRKSTTAVGTFKDISHPLGAKAVFASLVRSNFSLILKRIASVNDKLAAGIDPLLNTNSSTEDVCALDAIQLEKVKSLVQILEREMALIPATVPAIPYPSSKTFGLDNDTVAIIVHTATTWSYEYRLPILDLLRCMAVSSAVAEFIDSNGHNVLDLVLPQTPPHENNIMMVLRLITNLFMTVAGGQLVVNNADKVVDFISEAVDCGQGNRSLMVALASVVSNIASFAQWEKTVAGQLSLDQSTLLRLIKIIATPIMDFPDGEVVYRSLVALGNLIDIQIDPTYTASIRAVNAREWVNTSVRKFKDERIESLGPVILRKISELGGDD